VIATEDIRFYNHHGIDVKSLFRVAIKTMMLQKDYSGGGSTISQ
jgi:penicillin-binding protein 1A